MSDFHKNLAIVIGINDYENGIHPLTNAQGDALELADILESTRRFIHSPKKITKAHYDRFINSPGMRTK